MSASQNLQKWIVMQMADPTPAGAVSFIELIHTIEDQRDRIEAYEISDDSDPGDVAAQIYEAASSDAESRAQGGVRQRYVVCVFRGEDKVQPTATRSFTLQGASRLDNELDYGQSSDPPTEKGLLGQLMRHNDQNNVLLVRQSEGVMGRMIQQLNALQNRNEYLEGHTTEVYQLYQQLLDTKARRDLEEAKELAKERRHDQLMSLLGNLAPLILMQLLGQEKKLPNNGGSLRDHAVGKFLDGLSSEEFVGCLNALKGFRRVAFAELMKTYKEGKLAGVTTQMRDQMLQGFFAETEQDEIMSFMGALSPENLELFKPLYKSYARSYEEEQSKKPDPFKQH